MLSPIFLLDTYQDQREIILKRTPSKRVRISSTNVFGGKVAMEGEEYTAEHILESNISALSFNKLNV